MKNNFKTFIYLLGLLMLLPLVSCGGGGGGGGNSGGGGGGGGSSFSTSDLEGTWNHLIKGSTIYGVVDLDANGMVIGGSNVEIGAGGSDYTHGDTVSITSSGSVSGSLGSDAPETAPLLTPGDTHTITSGQMSMDKGLFITAGSTPDETGLFIKTGSSYSQSDLQGQWKYGNQNEYGDFIFDAGGNVTGGSTYITPNTYTGPSTGVLTVDGFGNITGTVNSLTVVSGFMSADKNVLFLAFAEDNAYVAVKMNASFDLNDLETFNFKFVTYSNTGAVGYGNVRISGDIATLGDIIGGNWYQVGGGSGTYTGGNVATELDGQLSGTLETNDGRTFTIRSGQISSTKNFSINVSTVSPGGDSELTLLVRTP